jgi:hypothetical protein
MIAWGLSREGVRLPGACAKGVCFSVHRCELTPAAIAFDTPQHDPTGRADEARLRRRAEGSDPRLWEHAPCRTTHSRVLAGLVVDAAVGREEFLMAASLVAQYRVLLGLSTRRHHLVRLHDELLMRVGRARCVRTHSSRMDRRP